MAVLWVQRSRSDGAHLRAQRFIARRIVPWSRAGEAVEKGHRFGMIRFGSRTDIFFPLDTTLLVKIGDRVEGGSTVFARLANGYISIPSQILL